MLKKLSIPAQKLLILILIITGAFFAIGVILCFALPSMTTTDILPIALGIFIMLVVNLAKLMLLEYQVNNVLKMDDQNKARLFAIGQGLIRFIVTGAGLVAAHFLPRLILSAEVLPNGNHSALYAAIAAAFGWNIAVYVLRFMKLDEETEQ